MREIITLILERYSSDDDILKCCWYKNNTNVEEGITRSQRAKYSIQGGFSDERVFEILELDEDDDKDFIKDTLKSFTNLFTELNEHTHLREKRFNIAEDHCSALFPSLGTSCPLLVACLRQLYKVDSVIPISKDN
ncbi:MAG: hypothetical protein ACJASU_002522 [Cognaticolwellia sp.]|jgi:hypothetical protein